MKNIFKYLTLAFMGLAAVSCSDEDIISQGRPVAGDEILFGAEGAFDKGELPGDSKDSRTAYGDVTGEPGKQKIAINWCEGDQMTIFSSSSPGAKQATYRVPIATVEPQPAKEGQVVPGKSNTGILERISEGAAGIQWSNGENHFYAVYPSIAKMGTNTLNFDEATKKVTGTMPATYTAQVADPVVDKNNHKIFTVQPSMDYAFMVADALYSKPQNAAGLTFKPIVTALEFEIVMNDFLNTTRSIEILSLELKAKNNSLVGSFEYDFGSGLLKNTSAVGSGTNFINMGLSKSISLAKDDKVNATFFIVPNENALDDPTAEILKEDSLTLSIMYTDQDHGVFFKSAVVGVDIHARKKYYFRDVRMPKLNPLTTSNWFSHLDDNIYISQLSFPTAGNVVSNQYNGTNKAFHREQVYPFIDLWRKGVRGFELRSSFTETKPADLTLPTEAPKDAFAAKDGKVTAYEFGYSPFACSGQAIFGKGGLRMGGAITTAYEELEKNPEETIVLIMTYQSFSGDNNMGYRPDLYLEGLQNFLDGLCLQKGITDKSTKFVQLGTESTVGDLRGKMAIVVRLYDNVFYEQNTATIKKSLAPNETWKNLITVVDDWGTCIDNWDVRYGATYAREGAFLKTGLKEFEKTMRYRASYSDYTCDPADKWGKIPDVTDHPYTEVSPLTWNDNIYKFNVNQGYKADPTTGNRSATVQCWERVIPSTDFYSTGIKDELYGLWNAYLWYEWQESLNEKITAAKNTVDRAIKSKGKSSGALYINSLAGYFPVKKYTDMAGSNIPYSNSVAFDEWHGGDHLTLSFGGQVTGGDYSACSGILNHFMYDYLTSKPADKLGPLGLIMMDYLGAKSTDFTGNGPNINSYKINVKDAKGNVVNSVSAEQAAKASTELPRLIIANNFHFPLVKKVTKTTQTSSPQKVVGNGNIISFE